MIVKCIPLLYRDNIRDNEEQGKGILCLALALSLLFYEATVRSSSQTVSHHLLCYIGRRIGYVDKYPPRSSHFFPPFMYNPPKGVKTSNEVFKGNNLFISQLTKTEALCRLALVSEIEDTVFILNHLKP